MKKIAPVVGLNLLILICYAAAIKPSLIADMMIAVALHTIACLGVSIFYSVKRNRQAALAWIIAMLVVLVTGFSTCVGLFRLNL